MSNAEQVNNENLSPPPLERQQTQLVIPNTPPVPPEYEPMIVQEQDENDPLLQIHGQFDFRPIPNGLDGYSLEDYENVARNNGWYVPPEWDEESIPETESDLDVDDLYVEDMVMHSAVNNFDVNPPN